MPKTTAKTAKTDYSGTVCTRETVQMAKKATQLYRINVVIIYTYTELTESGSILYKQSLVTVTNNK